MGISTQPSLALLPLLEALVSRRVLCEEIETQIVDSRGSFLSSVSRRVLCEEIETHQDTALSFLTSRLEARSLQRD
jgi:hypothetical protein